MNKSKRAVLIRLAKYFWQYKIRVIIAFVLMVTSNVFALLGPYLTGIAIDSISLENGIDFQVVAYYCLLMAVFYLASAVLAYFLSILMIHLSQKIATTMRRMFLIRSSVCRSES